MNPPDIIAEFYRPGTKTYNVLMQHGKQVADKAVNAASKVPHLNPDLNFIREASMLHDIGIFLRNSAVRELIHTFAMDIWEGKFLKARDCRNMHWFANGMWVSA